MSKVGIVGYGVIGKIMFNYFNIKYDTIFYDPAYPETSASMEDIDACNLAVICVPTPSLPSGECDTSLVEKAIEKLKNTVVLIKSTVSPGTTDRLKETYNKHIIFSPEYCGESTYVTGYNWDQDVKNEPFYILGGDNEDTSHVIDILAQISGPAKTYYQCSAVEAEIIKYMENMFLASKVIFAYEMNEVCRVFGADFHKVRQGWLLDPRINPASTLAFKDNIQPYSGKCLPKDTSAIVQASTKAGYDPKYFRNVVESNSRIRKIREERKAKDKK